MQGLRFLTNCSSNVLRRFKNFGAGIVARESRENSGLFKMSYVGIWRPRGPFVIRHGMLFITISHHRLGISCCTLGGLEADDHLSLRVERHQLQAVDYSYDVTQN